MSLSQQRLNPFSARPQVRQRVDQVETRQIQASGDHSVMRHAPMVVGQAPSMEGNGADAAGSTVLNSLDLAAAIGQALTRAGLNHKQACAWMEMDPGLWSRQLQGDGHISFQRLLKLPVAFWTEFVPLLAEPIGLNVSHEDIADRALMQAAFALDQITRAVVQMRQHTRRAG